jgi:hypothetical protein
MGNFNKLFNSKNPMKISGNTGNGTTYSSAVHGPLAYSPLKQMEEETAPVEPVEGEQGEQPGIAGQDTGEVTTESDGTKYVTSEYDVQGGVQAGDKIIIPPKWYGNIMGDVNMLQDEDYSLTKVSEGVWTISGGLVQEGPTTRETTEREKGTWQGE